MLEQKKHIRPYQQRMKAILWVYGILSLLVVPALTLYLGAFGDPFKDSFSYIGNLGGQRATFLIWTLALCAYFSAVVHTLVVLTKSARPSRCAGWCCSAHGCCSSQICYHSSPNVSRS